MFQLPTLLGSCKQHAITHLYAEQICRTSLVTWISHIKGLFQELFFFPVEWESLRSRGPVERGLSGPRGMGTSSMRGSRAALFLVAALFQQKFCILPFLHLANDLIPTQKRGEDGPRKEKEGVRESCLAPSELQALNQSPWLVAFWCAEQKMLPTHRRNPVAALGREDPTPLWWLKRHRQQVGIWVAMASWAALPD